MGLRDEGARLELCTAVLLLCWLCCGPHHRHESNSRRRSGEVFSRRIGSSAISLHLPSTSGSSKQPLSAHRSHEEIRSRRKSTNEARYHSAPSVIDEVLHRRDWERSSKELYIPLRPLEGEAEGGPPAACARPGGSSGDSRDQHNAEPKKCKKHHTNIKSSKNRCKESNKDDIKDTDATEAPNFYIGDATDDSLPNNEVGHFAEYDRLCEARNKWSGKGDKQSMNESIKQKEEADRSGAVHHSMESRTSFGRPYPLPSVEVVGYEGGACYLRERDPCPWRASGVSGAGRARHASDGDILAPPHRPESGAFSESDVDIELDGSDERPPPYHELRARDHTETAI